MSEIQEVERLLAENDNNSLSSLSCSVSFTTDDILMEPDGQNEVEDDEEGLFDDGMSEKNETEEKHESQQKATTMKEASLDNSQLQSTLSNNFFRLRQLTIPKQVLSDCISYNVLKNVTRAFQLQSQKGQGLGVPSCLSCQGKQLAVGTTLSTIAVFQTGDQTPKILQPPDDISCSQVTCLSISPDGKFLVSAYQNGAIALYDMAYFTLSKLLPPFSRHPISKILFWKDTFESFVSCDTDNNVYIHYIERYVWVSVRSKRLLGKANIAFHDIKNWSTSTGNLLLLASLDLVLVISLFPQVDQINKIYRPIEIPGGRVPNVQATQLDIDILLVSWASSIYLYQYEQGGRIHHFNLLKVITTERAIYNMQLITDQMLLIVDASSRVQLIRLSNGEVINTQEGVQPYYQKFHRDRRGFQLKNYTNTLSRSKQSIYFITNGEVIRGRLSKWTDFVGKLIERKEWTTAFKVVIDIQKRKLNVFAQKIQNDRRLRDFMQNMAMTYVRTNLTVQTSHQILLTVIQFCLETEMQEFLYQSLYPYLHQYSQQFYHSLKPFLQYDIKLRNQVFKKMLDYCSQEGTELLDQLIMQNHSQNHQIALEVCERLQRYEAMAYVMQLQENWQQLATKLLKEESIHVLIKVIQQLSEGNSILGKALSQESMQNGVKAVITWMLTEENYALWLNINIQNYFRCLVILLVSQKSSVFIQTNRQIGLRLLEMRDHIARNYQSDTVKEMYGCLISVNRKWAMDIQTRLACLQNLKKEPNMDDLGSFLRRNYEFLKDDPRWPQIYEQLPTQAKALISLDENKSQAFQYYKQIHINPQILTRLFDRLNRYMLSSNIEKLANMDIDRTAMVLLELFSHEQISNEVDKLSASLTRYQMIRRLMKIDKEHKIEWSPKVLLGYLENLCKYRTERRVLHELKKNIFPIEQALKTVGQFGYLRCQAYLSQPSNALTLLRQLYNKTFMDNFRKVMSYEYSSCHDMTNIYEDMLKLLKDRHTQNAQDWFLLLNTVLQPLMHTVGTKEILAQKIQQIYKKKGSEAYPFFNRLFQILQKTLLEVSMHTSIQELTQQVQKYLSVLRVPFVLSSFKSTLETYNRECQLFKTTNQLILGDMERHFGSIIEEQTIGTAGYNVCGQCGQAVAGSKTYVFHCGHTYHHECVNLEKGRPKCWKCRGEVLEQQIDNAVLSKTLSKQSLSAEDDNATHFLLVGFDQMTQRQEEEMDKFTALYDSFMLLHK